MATQIRSIERTDIQNLANVTSSGAPCLSIYLPAPQAGPETLEGPRRLKTLLGEARQQLELANLDQKTVARFLKPLESLMGDNPFWQHQFGGLGVFVTEDFFQTRQTTYALPDQVIIGPRFHLKPLLPMWTEGGEFLLLALSRNEVALYRVTRYALETITLDDVPPSQEEALRFDDPEKSLHVHPGQPGSQGGQTAITHGHGAARENSKERALRFFQRLDRALKPHLRDENMPLLLAGVDYYLPLYRKANSYPHLVNDIVSGNPEEVSQDDLRQAAWAVMQPLLQKPRDLAAAAIKQGIAHDQATDELEQAITFACQGRADKCFVSLDEYRWGSYDESTAAIQFLDRTDPEAVDLLDLAAMRTLAQGGDVFPVSKDQRVPWTGPIAVLKRF